MSFVRLAERESTVLAEADVVVVGATLAGISAALTAARQGERTCLVEAGTVLGTEIGGAWNNVVPDNGIGQRITELCLEQGGAVDNRVDVLLATIAFDLLLEEAGVLAIVRVQAIRILTDDLGKISGIEVVGKSGRQAVLAPVVIDATDGRVLAHQAVGAETPPVTEVERRFYMAAADSPASSVAVSSECACVGDAVRIVPTVWPREVLVSCTIAIAAGSSDSDIAWRSWKGCVDVAAYLREHTEGFTDAVLMDVAPAYEVNRSHVAEALDALEGTGLVMIPRAVDAGDEMKSAVEAVEDVLALASLSAIPATALPESETELVTSELTADPDNDFESITLPPVMARLHAPHDVAVAGYGTGGSLAALAAAERGASVVAVDPAPMPGGIATAGRISGYYHGLPAGRHVILDEVAAGRGDELGPHHGYHPVAKGEILLDAMQQSGVRLFAGHTVFGVVKRGDTVEGLLTAAPDGYHAVPCKVIVDGTGDADVAAAAGAATRLGREGDGFPQPYSYTPSRCSEGKLAWHNFDAGWVDPTDTLEFSRAHVEGRRRIWEGGPFSDSDHYLTLGSILGLRESRFVVGPVSLTFDDFLEGRTYPDSVCDAYAHYDNHAVDYAQESDWARRLVSMCGMWRFFCRGEVPYRALLVDGVEGLIMGSRGISIDHDLHQLLRMQPDIQKIGEIAGVAAAIASETFVSPSHLDVSQLLLELQSRGLLPATPPEKLLDLPADELLARLGTDESGIAMYRLSRLPAERAPDWSGFFASEQDAERRFLAAIAASLSTVPSDEARAVLRDVAMSKDMGPHMGGAHRISKRCTVAALALCEMKAPEALECAALLLKQDELGALDAMLVMKGLEILGDPIGVETIRAFLGRTNMPDLAIGHWATPAKPDRSFGVMAELCAVRTLISLGCRDEVHRLEPYIHSDQLLFRKYARRLAELAKEN